MVVEYLFAIIVVVELMLSSNIAIVLVVVSPVLLVVRLECRAVSLIVCFISMVALVLSFTI
jgi:hypothetical protein